MLQKSKYRPFVMLVNNDRVAVTASFVWGSHRDPACLEHQPRAESGRFGNITSGSECGEDPNLHQEKPKEDNECVPSS